MTHLLMADVTTPGSDTEAEPVVIDSYPTAIVLTLDDGTQLTLPRAELEAVLSGRNENERKVA